MATHTIMLPTPQDDTLRSIVWDDVAGTFSGEHSAVPWLNDEAERAARGEPVRIMLDDCSIDVRDPGHDPADLLRLLTLVWQGVHPPGESPTSASPSPSPRCSTASSPHPSPPPVP
ncbi:MAG: hypothetical protein GDA49_05575 [Rhodospirillales bacterium]|nr:hypothetical protein [Rhodospirillales bacterium]